MNGQRIWKLSIHDDRESEHLRMQVKLIYKKSLLRRHMQKGKRKARCSGPLQESCQLGTGRLIERWEGDMKRQTQKEWAVSSMTEYNNCNYWRDLTSWCDCAKEFSGLLCFKVSGFSKTSTMQISIELLRKVIDRGSKFVEYEHGNSVYKFRIQRKCIFRPKGHQPEKF